MWMSVWESLIKKQNDKCNLADKTSGKLLLFRIRWMFAAADTDEAAKGAMFTQNTYGGINKKKKMEK